MNMNEVNVLVEQTKGSIHFNYQEIKAFVQNVREKYSGIVVTEETTRETKKDVANLRKLYKFMDERRKDVKGEYMEAFNQFDRQVKECMEDIIVPIRELDEQIKEFERQKKENKKKAIVAIFPEIAGDMAEYIVLDKIYNPKWENTSVSLSSIKAEISNFVASIKMSVETIKSMNSECVEEALAKFKIDLSLSNAIAFINQYEARRAEILQREKERKATQEKAEEEARKRKLEAERAAAEEKKHIEQERKKQEEANSAFMAAVIAETEDDVPDFTEDSVPDFAEDDVPDFTGDDVPDFAEDNICDFVEKTWKSINVFVTSEEYLELVGVLEERGIKVQEVKQ